MVRYSLDANMISYILRKDMAVAGKFGQAVTDGHEFVICPMVYYELRRGLIKKDASVKIPALERMVSQFLWLEFNRHIWHAAAQGWADTMRQGSPSEDADLLIAYHAHHYSAVIVTRNVKHFSKFPVEVENWAT